MPLLKLETTAAISEAQQADLLHTLSRLVADTIGKPEQYVMVTVARTDILMSGEGGHAAFVDLRSIGGINGQTNRELTRRICEALQKTLSISPDRVYVTFADVPATNWGWNGATFG
jgi:phenylpyruvate tautomerase